MDPIQILFRHKDTNILALAEPTACLEPSYFHTDTIYFGGKLLCSNSSSFKGQHAFGVCLHVLNHKCFAPAQPRVVLSLEHFCFQVAKNSEDFASNGNPIAKTLLSYFRGRQPPIPTLHAANHPPGTGKSPLVPPGLALTLSLPGHLMLG